MVLNASKILHSQGLYKKKVCHIQTFNAMPTSVKHIPSHERYIRNFQVLNCNFCTIFRTWIDVMSIKHLLKRIIGIHASWNATSTTPLVALRGAMTKTACGWSLQITLYECGVQHPLEICRVVPLPSNSHHRDCYAFGRGSRTRASFFFCRCCWEGGQPKKYDWWTSKMHLKKLWPMVQTTKPCR